MRRPVKNEMKAAFCLSAGVGLVAAGIYLTRDQRSTQFTLEANVHVIEGRELYLKGDFKGAENKYARAIAVQSAVGTGPGVMAEVLYGDACKAQAKYEAAERSYLKAMKRVVGGSRAPALSPALRLAHLYEEDMGRSEDARGILNRRVEIATLSFGAEADQTLSCVEDLAGFEGRSGHHVASLHLYQGLLKRLPRSHGQVPTILSHVVSSYIALEKFDDAEKAARDAVRVCRNQEGDFVALAHHNLGQVLEMRGRFAASDDAFETALKVAQSPAVRDTVRESLRQRGAPEL